MKEYRLYILMRNDMESMVPGKAIAQGSHATSVFTLEAERAANDTDATEMLQLGYRAWKASCVDAFGTTIVLGASEQQIKDIITEVKFLSSVDETADSYYGIVIDPTYPIRDGKVTHLVPLMTCAYVFCEVDGKVHKTFGHLGLY